MKGESKETWPAAGDVIFVPEKFYESRHYA